MTNENHSKTLQKIKKTHERIVITVGIFMGLALSTYFFTYGMLIDRDATFMIWFQLVTTVLFIFGLIFIKRLGLFLTRILLAANSECRQALKGMTVKALEKVGS